MHEYLECQTGAAGQNCVRLLCCEEHVLEKKHAAWAVLVREESGYTLKEIALSGENNRIYDKCKRGDVDAVLTVPSDDIVRRIAVLNIVISRGRRLNDNDQGI